jgi:hypothetical protein
MFLPLTRSIQACVSKSMPSTLTVSVVRTLLLAVLPVEDSVVTFLKRNKPVTKQPLYTTMQKSDVRVYAKFVKMRVG